MKLGHAGLFSMLLILISLLAISNSHAGNSNEFIPLGAAAIRGKTVMLDEGSTLEYRSDGSYVYTLGTRVSRGQWRVGNNSQICVDFSGGNGRCDSYLEMNGGLYLKNSYGKLFKVRFAK